MFLLQIIDITSYLNALFLFTTQVAGTKSSCFHIFMQTLYVSRCLLTPVFSVRHHRRHSHVLSRGVCRSVYVRRWHERLEDLSSVPRYIIYFQMFTVLNCLNDIMLLYSDILFVKHIIN